MLEGPLVFIDIDTQRDFLEPGGALYVSGSDAIIPNLRRLTSFALAHHVPILASACAHLPGDPELKRFPAHCLAGTPGADRVAATAVADSVVLDLEERLTDELPGHLTLKKREIDVFSRPDTAELVSRYNWLHPTFVVYGVATDYCVARAANGLLNAGCRVAIVVDAVRGIDPTSEPATLTDLAHRGVLLTTTEVVCRQRNE
jgi:nicotinamidase/pyrazinamidase